MRWALTKIGRVLLTLGILSPPGSLSAEPISVSVNTGSIVIGGEVRRERGLVRLSGDNGFSLSAAGDTNLDFCPCAPGQQISLSGFIGRITGTVTYEGSQFNIDFFDGGRIELLVSRLFDLTDTADPVTFTAPFSMSGFVFPRVFGTLTRFDLTGSGVVTASYVRGGPTVVLDSIRYEFAPVPEPSSIVLLTAGLAATIRGIRRRAQAMGRDFFRGTRFHGLAKTVHEIRSET